MSENVWEQILARIESKVNRHSYHTWFRPTRFLEDTGQTVTVQVPNELFRNWLTKHYAGIIGEATGELQRQGTKIAFVTERSEDDMICQRMREYGELHIFKTVADVPTANQAKVARHFLAASLENEVSTIEDVDTAPLQRDFWVPKFKNRKEGHMLAVGAELKVYTGINENKFPISTMTAEGHVFKDLFNTPLYNTFLNMNSIQSLQPNCGLFTIHYFISYFFPSVSWKAMHKN